MIPLHNKIKLVLNVLLDSQRIQIKDEIYLLAEDYEICMERNTYQNDVYIGKTLLRTHMSFKEFIEWIQTFSDSEINNIVFNSALRVK